MQLWFIESPIVCYMCKACCWRLWWNWTWAIYSWMCIETCVVWKVFPVWKCYYKSLNVCHLQWCVITIYNISQGYHCRLWWSGDVKNGCGVTFSHQVYLKESPVAVSVALTPSLCWWQHHMASFGCLWLNLTARFKWLALTEGLYFDILLEVHARGHCA